MYKTPALLLVAFAIVCAAPVNAQTDQAAPSGMISFTMPYDGSATVAVNNAQGVRVRNLFGDLHFTKGAHAIEWDGCDDTGKPVPPGSYRWVGLYHDAMHAVYRGSFQYGNPPWLYGTTGDWTADHSAAEAVLSVGDRVLIGSPESEYGHGLIASDLDGNKQWGVVWLAKHAWAGAEALAAVGDRVFANSNLEQNTVWEVDPGAGKSWVVLEKNDLPADKVNAEPKPPAISAPGLRVIGGHKSADGTGELFVVDLYGSQTETFVFAPGKLPGDKLTLLRVLPVRPWGLAWLPDGRCVAALDKTIDILDTATGETKPLVSEGLSAPFGIATDAKGRIYVSDQGNTGRHQFTKDGQLLWRALRLNGDSSQQVKIFDSKGNLLRAIGVKGGQQPGKIDPESFYQPAGIAIDARGQLWVTEFTTAPKRVTVWQIPDDLTTAAPNLAKQFVGPAAYGGGAAMIDPAEPWRIMDTNYGVVFDVDLSNGQYRPVDLPWRQYDSWKEAAYMPDLPFLGAPSMVFPIDGRKFSVCNGGYMHGPQAHWEPFSFNGTGPALMGEYKGDVFVPEAAVGNMLNWLRNRELMCRREEQWIPPVVLEAARKLPDWPKYAAEIGMAPDASDVPHVFHQRGNGVYLVSKWPQEINGFIWIDNNGDGKMQSDEIHFGPCPIEDSITLDSRLNVYFHSDRKPLVGVWRLPRQGFGKTGAPVYNWNDLTKISERDFGVEHVADDGSILSYGALHSADAKLVWSYPVISQRLRSLGGNVRDALLPGRVYSINNMQGVVKGPGSLGDVYMLHSVDGMSYFLTRNDGLFICTMFRPYPLADNWDANPVAKPGMLLDDYSVGEESFCGSFARAEASGQGFEKDHYYMLGMSRSAVVELTGLDSAERFPGGTVQLAAGAGLYGKGRHFDPVSTVSGQILVPKQKAPEPLESVSPVPGMDLFHGKPAQFATANVWTGWDKRGLHMKWQVEGDRTTFMNNEKDWTMAFATGDVCDLQLKSPTLGRCRYIMTMNEGRPVVVRFRYDARDTGQGADYKSGVQETRVPVVEKLAISPEVRRGKTNYFLQITLPWDVLGIQPRPGLSVPMELGVFYSDPTGHKVSSREYWHSRSSAMVSDVPTEAEATADWGALIFK